MAASPALEMHCSEPRSRGHVPGGNGEGLPLRARAGYLSVKLAVLQSQPAFSAFTVLRLEKGIRETRHHSRHRAEGYRTVRTERRFSAALDRGVFCTGLKAVLINGLSVVKEFYGPTRNPVQ